MKAPLFETTAISVKQPLGEFYIAAIPAEILLQTCFSHRLKAKKSLDGSYRLEGSQRLLNDPRLKQIGEFIDTVEAAFPNSVILAANFKEETGELESDEDTRWTVSHDERGVAKLTIPTSEKLAAIIDGQHRLFGFGFSDLPGRKSMPLVCAIYFDLPKPYQAFLFATINSNQKSVDKSQTYELFGYNVEDQPPECWTPDKLAVFLTRKLNSEKDSPFYEHIVIAAENDIVQTVSEARRSGDWMVSTATIVEGILKLISKNAKKDAYFMNGEEVGNGRERSILEDSKPGDKTPLRSYFRDGNDTVILKVVKNYFSAASEVFWQKEDPGFIRKTIGIQALFDVLRHLVPDALSVKNISQEFFKIKLHKAGRVDFSDDYFQASGTGRTRIRNVLEIAIGWKSLEDFQDSDRKSYSRLLGVIN